MTDLRKTWDPNAFTGTLGVHLGDLDTRDELATAVLNSLFTWRRARPDDRLPDDSEDRKGWWGDTFPDADHDQIGSRLWLLSREKLTQHTMNRARDYMQEALQWLIEDGVASRVELLLEKRDPWTLAIQVTIYRRAAEAVVLRFDAQWEALAHA